MKKIPCVFQKNESGDRAINAVHQLCQWVLDGEGEATIKFDGTACAVIDGKLYARYDAKKGKTPPPNAIPCCEPDPVTGHHPHWIPCGPEPQFKWHWEGWLELQRVLLERGEQLDDATFELCGPKVQGNPHGLDKHHLIRHGTIRLLNFPRTFQGMKEWFEHEAPIEGVVFHHPDGRMAKIRRRDFGLPWPVKG